MATLPTISDEQLYRHSGRVERKVVLITGGASGIGRQTALDFAKHKAKLVIADLDYASAESLCQSICTSGGEAIARKCDVTSWKDQVSLFKSAIQTFGSVDIVIASAGVPDIGDFFDTRVDDKGLPFEPSMKTLDINLTGVLYTTRLAHHFMCLTKTDLKALVFLGSLASWTYTPGQPLYTASKHGVLGLMRTIDPMFQPLGIRVACIHPFFVRTNIIPPDFGKRLEGIRLPTVERVAGTIFYASTDPDPKSNGCSWLLDDDGPVVQIMREEFKVGLFRKMDDRRAKRRQEDGE